MPQRRYDKHSAEFRAEAIRLARSGQASLAQIAREFGVKEGTLRWWVAEARPDDERPVTEDERTELRRLRALVRTLRQERDVLKKAAAFFAKHSV